LFALALLGLPASTAAAAQRGTVQKVQLQDDCNPATFNAVLGPGACVGDGDTTFARFVAELTKKGSVGKWRIHSDHVKVRPNGVVTARNVGGEFHTFTMVQHFGGGCVPELNGPLTPVPECGDPTVFDTTGLPPGFALQVKASNLKPGVHHFQCLIHPWMHADVLVRR
jgi:hypothetical protein